MYRYDHFDFWKFCWRYRSTCNWGESARTALFYDLQWDFQHQSLTGDTKFTKKKSSSHLYHNLGLILNSGLNSDIFEITIIEEHLKSNPKSAEAQERKVGVKVSSHARKLVLTSAAENDRKHDDLSKWDL